MRVAEPTVYLIRNTVNGKVYIGVSNNVEKRFLEHFSALRAGKHSNKALQADYNTHGQAAFTTGIIENLNEAGYARWVREDRERHWIKQHNATNPMYGYNIDSRQLQKAVAAEYKARNAAATLRAQFLRAADLAAADGRHFDAARYRKEAQLVQQEL